MINRTTTKIWQEERHDRIIRNEVEFYNAAKYILNNPRERWGVHNYTWMWFKSPEEKGGHGGPPYTPEI